MMFCTKESETSLVKIPFPSSGAEAPHYIYRQQDMLRYRASRYRHASTEEYYHH